MHADRRFSDQTLDFSHLAFSLRADMGLIVAVHELPQTVRIRLLGSPLLHIEVLDILWCADRRDVVL